MSDQTTEGKTIREWLNELPEPADKKSIEYFERTHGKEADRKCGSMLFAICSAFPWEFTDEGYEYWAELAFSEAVMESINKEE